MRCADGSYIQAPYIPGAVLVNLGALMQRWTSDKYLATVSMEHEQNSLSLSLSPASQSYDAY